MIDYSKKLNTKRAFYPIEEINGSFESDRGRVVSSPAFRRLQKRTQVFALELNAAVRSRLTHSLEVSQTSRYIAKTIFNEIKSSNKLEEYNLQDLENAFVSSAEVASLLHDIGNPPFGHFAERAINDWMSNKGVHIFENVVDTEEYEHLASKLIKDLTHFDGNAQGIRIIDKLQRLNLSYSQSVSILKYTRGAFEDKPSKDDKLSYLKKKGGFFYSEKDFVEKITQELEMESGHRFPITYIMEAADDISYLTADIEDAVDKGILTLEDVKNLIIKESERINNKYGTNETFLADIVEKNYERSKKEEKPYRFDLFLTLTRATLVNSLVKYVSKVFIENHKEIFHGSFNCALLDFNKENRHSIAVEILSTIAFRDIFSHREIETLELQGHRIIMGIFDSYKKLLFLKYEDLEKLLEGERIGCYISQRLFKRLPKKHIVAYSNSIEKLDKSCGSYAVLEWYYRARLLIDYISGMTDDFALDEYKTLTVS